MNEDCYLPYVLRKVRIKTQQIILSDVPRVHNLPIRKWRVEIFVLNELGEEKEASLFDSVIYYLHPSFETSTRRFSKPPFTLDEQGWGEFEMRIVAKLKFSTTTYTFHHRLSFDDNAYNVDFEGRFPFNNPKVRNELLRYGNVPKIDEDEINPVSITNLQKAIHIITLSDVETIQNIINSIVTFPPVSEEITKHFHGDDEFVILLSQLPTNLIEKICNMVETTSTNDV